MNFTPGVVVNSLSVPVTGMAGFSYAHTTMGGQGELGILIGNGNCGSATGCFELDFLHPATAFYTGTGSGVFNSGDFAFYDIGGEQEVAFTGSYTVNSAVPEPATWALMIGGFGAIAAGARRRRVFATA